MSCFATNLSARIADQWIQKDMRKRQVGRTALHLNMADYKWLSRQERSVKYLSYWLSLIYLALKYCQDMETIPPSPTHRLNWRICLFLLPVCFPMY